MAGMLAATYAEACFYQATSAVCVTSGTTVDSILWSNGASSRQPVITSADWIVYSQDSSHYLVTVGTGAGGYQGYYGDGGSLPPYCTGPVHFADASGNTASVSSWSQGSIGGSGYSYMTPDMANIFAGTGASGTCQ